MADILQDQYASVFSDPASKEKKSAKIEDITYPTLEDISFTQEDVIKAINEIGTFSHFEKRESSIPFVKKPSLYFDLTKKVDSAYP